MYKSGLIYWAAVGIALITVASGALQMVCPATVLRMVGGEIGPSSDHFFGIVGMFMVLFGGLLFQGLLQGETIALFWAGLQKLGASGAVGLGVSHHLFSPLAWGLVGFDFCSAILILYLWMAGVGERR
jgi:hypothetical protein